MTESHQPAAQPPASVPAPAPAPAAPPQAVAAFTGVQEAATTRQILDFPAMPGLGLAGYTLTHFAPTARRPRPGRRIAIWVAEDVPVCVQFANYLESVLPPEKIEHVNADAAAKPQA